MTERLFSEGLIKVCEMGFPQLPHEGGRGGGRHDIHQGYPHIFIPLYCCEFRSWSAQPPWPGV